MAFNTGDLKPQSSGSASIGANQNGFHGFSSPPIPYAHVHLNSGIWHNAVFGQSGIIRLAPKDDLSYVHSHDGTTEYITAGEQTCFELSIDGGKTFPLRLGATRLIDNPESGPVQHAIIRTQNNITDKLLIYSSGKMEVIGADELFLLAFPNASTRGITVFGPIVDINSKNQTNLGSFGTVAIAGGTTGGRPDDSTFGDVNITAFQNSGLLHFRHNVPYESWYMRAPVSQNAGGILGNGEWPIAHSGNVNEMINKAVTANNGSLQAAYNIGNEIVPLRNTGLGYRGVVVRETIPGFDGGFSTNADAGTNKPSKYGVAVSGHTLTPTDANTYAFAVLNSASLMIASSGSVSALSRNFFLGYANATPELVFFNSNGSMRFAIGDTTGTGRGGQIDFRPFGGSGRLEYRFGPYQTWHARTSINTGGPLNDGYWPLSNSGQMLEQIVRREKSKNITIERPAVNNDLTWFYANQAITITEIESIVRGNIDASGQFAIRYGPDRSLAGTELTTNAITCANRTTGQITTSFAAPNIPVDNWVWIAVSGVSGVATSQLHVTAHYN